MKALCWHGNGDVRIDTVPDPKIEHPRDAIIRVTSTAICGSDLHLLDGYMPTMKPGDVLGHEFMGEVVEVGNAVSNLRKGDRVAVPFCIACGGCYFCSKKCFSCCDTTNPNAELAQQMMGHATAGMFGYSHLTGGYQGGQAEYVRVPYADVGPLKIPDGLSDEKVLFLTDIFPTGWMAAENADIEPGDTVAVWGCGPVGQFAIWSAWAMGAGRVIGIDRVPERLELARTFSKAETIDFSQKDVYQELQAMTNGRGPDRAIDAVGTEAHGGDSFGAVVDRVKAFLYMGTDRPQVLREAIFSVRKAGTVSVPGVYLGFLDHVPFGAAMNKGLTMKMGQTHMHRYMKPLLEKIEKGEIDPSRIITHRAKLDNAPDLYKKFRDKKDGCIKCVMTP
ncbi:MAG: glutathione-dependent formaldehyde dehydrogenase [Fimbriiglobus sp.]|jgi:threonine dehydrogenase-like Zn-dependent dehydrogenase|nr:glutathione-dependent formaldehyde dehydrogenase [Fimbriiglobus sp.]